MFQKVKLFLPLRDKNSLSNGLESVSGHGLLKGIAILEMYERSNDL